MSLKRGRRYFNIINSAFLCPPHQENFENEIAPLKTLIALSFLKKCLLFVQIREFQFLESSGLGDSVASSLGIDVFDRFYAFWFVHKLRDYFILDENIQP